jgi:hypothetical protein
MDEKKITELIDMYFDGELKKGEDTLLFTELAGNTEGRKYFRQISRIRSAVEESTEEFPEELDERILRSINRHMQKKSGFFVVHNIPAIISYAAVFIMLFLSGYVLMQINYYRDKVDDLSERMERQMETIKMLYNSLPSIEVRAASDNEIIIKPSL